MVAVGDERAQIPPPKEEISMSERGTLCKEPSNIICCSWYSLNSTIVNCPFLLDNSLHKDVLQACID